VTGPLISFRVYNQRVVVLNDLNVIRDLLDRRANSYSDRPKAWMYQELCDRKKSVFNVSSNDERHRIYRKLLQTGLGPRAIRHYSPIFESEALVLLEELEQDPDNYEAHFRR
jgi:cytochrome P450